MSGLPRCRHEGYIYPLGCSFHPWDPASLREREHFACLGTTNTKEKERKQSVSKNVRNGERGVWTYINIFEGEKRVGSMVSTRERARNPN